MGKLDNKVAIITGGNAGVGKEIAKLFASEGAKVVISARRQQVLEETAKEIEEAGGTVLCVPTDISKVDDVKNLVSKTVETFGQLDILINNAGVLDKGLNAIDQIDYDDLNRVIDINQKGTMYCMSEALKVMKSGASIVNISSVAGQYGAGGAVYVSTKAAIIGVTKHAAMRLENRNINLTDEQNNRLRSGVQKASEKGINESLVIVDSLAFIVNVPNKTVVTALDQKEAADNIFTNIDGAVII